MEPRGTGGGAAQKGRLDRLRRREALDSGSRESIRRSIPSGRSGDFGPSGARGLSLRPTGGPSVVYGPQQMEWSTSIVGNDDALQRSRRFFGRFLPRRLSAERASGRS